MAVRSAVTEVATNADQLVEVGRRFVDVARTFAARHRAEQPAEHDGVHISRFTVAGHRLEDYRLVRARYDWTSTTLCWPWLPGRCAIG